MKIAFIHYHLKTGGVTTVLGQQVEAIRDVCRTLVLSGAPPESNFSAATRVLDTLAYDEFRTRPVVTPDTAAKSVLEAIHAHFGAPADVVHVHNPTLSKNKYLLMILKALQQKGATLLLQCHDFAEDGRPQVYYSEPYPADCHYGVINSRDYDLLIRAGLKPKGLHRIFNTVKRFDFPAPRAAIANRVLYPIRAIRRKNIGEAILLSLYFRNQETLAITLPPNSPMDFTPYEDWKAFVREKHLNVKFDVGLTNDFLDLVQASRFLLTTSISEGFGFSFLEPWLADKLLWGRKLPEICTDFERNGIRLDHLYSHLLVPLDWIDKNAFHTHWRTCVERVGDRFNADVSAAEIETAASTITANDRIDFGFLNEGFQKQIISKLLTDNRAYRYLIRLNPYLSAPGFVVEPADLIAHNREHIQKNYALENYRQTLLSVYRQVADTAIRQQIDKSVLLKGFMDLGQFSLLKWCDDAG